MMVWYGAEVVSLCVVIALIVVYEARSKLHSPLEVNKSLFAWPLLHLLHAFNLLEGGKEKTRGKLFKPTQIPTPSVSSSQSFSTETILHIPLGCLLPAMPLLIKSKGFLWFND